MAESSGKMDAVSARNLFAEVGKLVDANRPCMNISNIRLYFIFYILLFSTMEFVR